MIKVNTRILATVALGLVLAACNNGGGGSSGNEAKPASTTKVYKATQVRTSSTVTNDAAGNRVSREFTTRTDGNDTIVVTVDAKTNKITGATLNGQPAVLGGNIYQAWANPNGTTTLDDVRPIGYLVYNSKQNGPSVIMAEKTENMIDVLTAGGYVRAGVSGKSEFTGISYDYTYSDATGKWTNVTGSDGKVTLVDGKTGAGPWNATLGEAQLTGTYYGKRVGGTATLNGVEGTFNGYDAYNKNNKDHETRGVFGGANATSTFGGVWAKKETMQ